jgi:hypothetical protein
VEAIVMDEEFGIQPGEVVEKVEQRLTRHSTPLLNARTRMIESQA